MADWEIFLSELQACTKCGLHEKRINVVAGRGSRTAKIMFVGEGPGEQEDIQGIPFVGAAGKLLENLLNAFMFDEESYYIANIVKCRPPGNRVPSDDEAEKCLPWLRTQFALIRPAILVCLGATALKHILGKEQKITQVRGAWQEKKGLLVMPTYHPAAILRDASKKVPLWEDIKAVKAKFDELNVQP